MLNLSDLPILELSDDPLPVSLINTVETIQFCVFCFTVPFYSFIVYFIIDAQDRKVPGFSTPFYKLCLSVAFIDMTTLLANYFGCMMPTWGWGVNIYLYLDKIFSHTYFYIAWAVGINQAMCAAVLTANRVSAILFVNRYKTFWSTRRLYISYFLQFAPGMLLAILTFFNPAQLYRNRNNGVVPKFMNTTMTNAYFLTGGVYLLSICIFLLASYCYLFVVIRQRGQKSLSNVRNYQSYSKAKLTAKTREFKLFMMSSAIVIVQFLLLLLFLNHFFNFILMSSDEFHLTYNVICDIYSSINPYLLWIFSDSLRDYILKRIGLKAEKKLKKVSVISANIFL